MSDSKFIYNSSSRNFFNTLTDNLNDCTEFKISVAFITYGGLQVLLRTLEELENKNIPGEILTTTYQNMTEPKVLEKLASFKNIKLKIYVPQTDEDGFHAKGYLFHKSYTEKDQWTIIIGSSNITGRALKTNVEWNVLQSEDTNNLQEPGTFSKSVLEEFNKLWESKWAKDYSDEFLIAYRDYITNLKNKIKNQKENSSFKFDEPVIITPNEMQQEAVTKLNKLRKTGENKALAIAATGSGKTYMSVFDVIQVRPKKVLFIVHREDILKKAKESFDNICSSVYSKEEYSSGFFTGNTKEKEKNFIFSTRDTISRHYEEFTPEEFDYIIIDEAHHATSESYKKVLSYFKPQFLLGLTATPERSDDGDIYSLFDNNVAVEIRLRQALDYNLVCPFHYFGLKDADGIDYTKIKAEPGTSEYVEELSKMLMVGYRVDYIIEKIKFYGHDGDKLKALGFCSTIAHAEYMADEFNKRGIKSIALSSKNNLSVNERDNYIKQLESDDEKLEVIFTVDLFNEGIDIPTVNTILMLRPTESSIIFIQQLGRGLRKLPDKEFVTVLDFIGNYSKSFLMAIALNGKNIIDKDNLKTEVQNDFADLPNGTYIQMDKITKDQILRQLENEKFMSTKYMRDSYLSFKHICGGRVPLLVDYLKHDGCLDPIVFTKFSSNYKTYIEFVAYMERDTHPEIESLLLNEDFKTFIRFMSFFSPAQRIEEWIIISSIINSKTHSASIDELKTELNKKLDIVNEQRLVHACNVLSGKYFDSAEIKRYGNSLCTFKDNSIKLSDEVCNLIDSNNDSMLLWIKDLINYSILRYDSEFGSNDYGYPFLKLYHEYSMRDIALLCNYEKMHSSFRGQGLITSASPDYFIFVNLHKNENIKESINYHDAFQGVNNFVWQSPNSTTQSSLIGQNLIKNEEHGIHLHLFVRKFESVEKITQPFIYLGKVSTHPESAHGEKPITMTFALHNPVPEVLYNDFTTRTDQLGKN